MKRNPKPNFIRSVLAYLAAATVFIVIIELAIQSITFIKTGEFLQKDEAYIACMKTTFCILFFAGFLFRSLGHFLMKITRLSFQTVIRQRSFAYAIGYISVVLMGVVSVMSTNPNIADQVITKWWVYLLTTIIIFCVALLAGKTFAHIYEQGPRLT